MATEQRTSIARGQRAVQPGTLADQLRVAIMHTSRRLRSEAADDLVSAAQFSVLAALKHSDATLRELAEREQVQAPSMTRTVAALVELGLVSRTTDPQDRRQVLVSLAPAGLALVAEARNRRTEWLAGRLAGLHSTERQVLADAAEILQRIIQT